MSDYRDRNDPLYGNTSYEPVDSRSGTSWGWIAGGAVFLVIVLALAFGVAHEPSRVASNDTQSTTHIAPHPMTTPAPSVVPGLAPPPATAPSTRP